MVTKTLVVGLLVLAGGAGCQKQTDSYNPYLSVSSRLSDGPTGILGEPYDVYIHLRVDIEEAEDSNRTETIPISPEDVVATCTAGCTVASRGSSERGVRLQVSGLEPGEHELHVEVRDSEDTYIATLPLRFAAVEALTVMYDSHTGCGATHAVLPGTVVGWCAQLLSPDGDWLLLPEEPITPLLAGFGEPTQGANECRTLIPEAPGTTTFTASYGDLHASHDLRVASAETAQDVVVWQVPDTVTEVVDWVSVEDGPVARGRRVDRIEVEVGGWAQFASAWILADGTTVLGGAADLQSQPATIAEKSDWTIDRQPAEVKWLFELHGVAPGAATLTLNKGDVSLSLPIVVREAAP